MLAEQLAEQLALQLALAVELKVRVLKLLKLLGFPAPVVISGSYDLGLLDWNSIDSMRTVIHSLRP